MDINIVWRTPIKLVAADTDLAQDFVVSDRDEKRIPEAPGVYVFSRVFGPHYEPIYIGQADNLRSRINQHLKTNVALMKALRTAKNGTRALLLAEVQTKQGQQTQRVLDIVRTYVDSRGRCGWL